MAITSKKPPVKESVGALYYCFNTPKEGTNDFTETYEAEVTKSEVVKSVTVTENGDTTNVYASGKVYDSISDVTSVDNELEVVAIDAKDLYKMRGDTVTESGAILSGKPTDRPFFAYGKVVKLRNGGVRLEWFPKCKLTENSDEAKTKEESFSEQNDKVVIRAYPYDADGNIKFFVDSTVKMPEGMTEDKFFAKPLLKEADLTAAISSAS